MTRKLYITALVLFSFLSGFTLNAQEIIPELKPSAIVDDSVITLGDLFTDLNEYQDIVVANAPEPGKKVLVSARHILKLTKNVRWRNSAGINNVVVSRMSTVVGVMEMKENLIAELKNIYQSDQNLDIRFYNGNAKIHLPYGYEVDDISIKNISLDKKNGKFSALIASPKGQGGETLHTVNGRTIKVTTVPSLARTIRNGDVIAAADIKWITLPENQIGRNIILSKDKLIGMTPRNQIKEGSAIRLNEVNRPVLVKRGSLVKINFNTGQISLSTLGKAVENGGKGDVIQVKNNSSNKIISAIVFAPNQVRVHADIGSLVLLN